MADFLDLEPLLIARLKAKLASTIHVGPIADLAAVQTGALPVPGVFVWYRGYRILGPLPAGAVKVEQRFLTVVAVRNVRDIVSGAPARSDAGPIMSDVLTALDRYLPGGDFKALQFDNAPDAAYKTGFGYFPLGWKVETRLHTQPAH